MARPNTTFRTVFSRLPDEEYPSMGLFPEDDDDLPKGLMRNQSKEVFAFFEAYQNLSA